MNFKNTAIAILCIFLPAVLSGQPFSEKRTFRKSLKVNREMTLEVRNKYGTIHISPSTGDSVNITAEIDASASSQEKIGKMLSGIDISITQADYLVIAQTQFNQSINTLFEDFKGMTNKIIQYDSKVQINYFITAPEYLNLRIDNKYGDIYMENNTGNTSISLSNGSFKAKSLKKAHDLTFSFCDATISDTEDATIDASFSEITIGESGTLKLSGISSKFDLKKAGRISTESRRDKFFIGSVSSLHGESYFTDFRIDKLSGDIDLLTKYGSVDAETVEAGFRSINLNTGYSDINLGFDPSASYNLDIRHTNTTLSLPEKNASLEKKQVSEENKEYITFGKVGNNPGNVNVNIQANRGSILIR